MEKPHSFLMENIITLLCHDDEHGKIISNLVTPDLFEGDYKLLAERVLNYWKQYNQAPKVHVYDLLGDIFSDSANRQGITFRRILAGMAQLHPTVNAKYILSSIKSFVRLQKFKHTTIRVADLMQRNQEMALSEVEELWYEILKSRELEFDHGMFLSDFERVIDYLEETSDEFQTGVKELNENYITPARKKVFVFIAPPGKGKSWWGVDIGKCNLRLRKKVVHINLEMPEEDIGLRYYQAFYGVPKYFDQRPKITTFQYEAERVTGRSGLTKITRQKLIGFGQEELIPEFAFKSDNIREELTARASSHGTLFDNLVIKSFPMRSLTMQGLEAYLDNLEIVYRFIPDLLILDYIGITKTSRDNRRIDLGQNLEDFIGLCSRRNIAGNTMHQVNRTGSAAKNVRMHHISEDWSIVQSAHNVVTQSQTEAEERHKLARLFVNKARTEKMGQTILISQNFDMGQYCIASENMTQAIEKRIDEHVGNQEDEDESGDED